MPKLISFMKSKAFFGHKGWQSINRLRFYHDLGLRITAEIKDQISHDGKEAQVVKKFPKVAKMDKSWKVLTKWLEYEAPARKNAQTVLEDVPEFLNQFLQNLSPRSKLQREFQWFLCIMWPISHGNSNQCECWANTGRYIFTIIQSWSGSSTEVSSTRALWAAGQVIPFPEISCCPTVSRGKIFWISSSETNQWKPLPISASISIYQLKSQWLWGSLGNLKMKCRKKGWWTWRWTLPRLRSPQPLDGEDFFNVSLCWRIIIPLNDKRAYRCSVSGSNSIS